MIKQVIEEICENRMTGQFFEASGPQGHFFEKTNKKVLDIV